MYHLMWQYWDGVEQRCVACSLCSSPLLEVRTPCSTFADTECGDTSHVRIQQVTPLYSSSMLLS